MSLAALEDVDDALDATRALLWPIDRSRWLKLALVALLVGGPGTGLNLNLGGGGGGGAPAPGPGAPPAGGPGELALPEPGVSGLLVIGALVAVVLAVALGLVLVGSIMEFVLVESLRRESVTLRRYWSERWRQGVRLFGFRVALGALVLGGLAVLAAVVVLPVLGVGSGLGPVPAAIPGALGLLGLVLVLPALVLVGLLVALVDGFTTAFVVPVMVLEDGGVLAGWRRLWPTLVASPWQYLAYAVLAFVLSLVGGIVVAILTVLGAVVLAVPFGLLAAVGIGLTAVVGPAGVVLIVAAALLFGLGVLAVVALAQVPVVTYLRYYALLVLGDVAPDLDLIPERRAAIRADGAGEADDGGDDGDGDR